MNKKLDKISAEAPKSLSRKKIEKETQEMYILIKELHKKMRAECKHSMLFVFQGMDASGKDGSIYKLFMLILLKHQMNMKPRRTSCGEFIT